MTAATTWRIDLPFTAPELRDNDRRHWAAKAKIVQRLRRDAWTLAQAANLPRNLAHVRITLHWQPGTNRTRDQLSIAPTLKPLIDGLTDYGLVSDDDIRHVQATTCIYEWQRGTPAACWLTITEEPA